MARGATAAGRPADDDPRRPDKVTPFVLRPVPLEEADTSSEVYVLLCFFSGLLCFTFHVRARGAEHQWGSKAGGVEVGGGWVEWSGGASVGAGGAEFSPAAGGGGE